MRHLGQDLKRFLKDQRGAYSTEWIAVMSMAIILTIGAVYTLTNSECEVDILEYDSTTLSYTKVGTEVTSCGLFSLASGMSDRTQSGNSDIDNLISALPSQD